MDDTLDPRDWHAFRARAHAMLDKVVDRMTLYGEGPVWSPPDVDGLTLDRAGSNGSGDFSTDKMLADLLTQGVGNTHPRFFGWVHGAGTPSNMIADMVAAGMNANCGGRNHAAIQIEQKLVDWCLDQFGLPETGSGLITTGTSMATIIALKVARDRALNFESRKDGLRNGPALVGYTSSGAHNCLQRAFDLLGLGADALRKIETDADGRMKPAALSAAIEADRTAGLQPFIICATAGTVNTGAIDPLTEIADIARQQDLWYHVDAAFGAALRFSDTHKHRLSGIGRADSIAFDFHKWMQVNYDAGCVLIRDGATHRRSFSDRPDYLMETSRGMAAGGVWPVDLGPELSRGFRALKVWAQINEHGTEKLGRVVERNIDQAAYLAQQVGSSADLELLAPVKLNICCFRFTSPGASKSELDALNEELVIRLQESGIAAPSTTRIDGRLAIRVNLTNHRTKISDMNILLDAVCRIGGEIRADQSAPDRFVPV